MDDRTRALSRVPEDGGPKYIELEADGEFHVILGTKEEHDGIKVQATTPAVVRRLLNLDYFTPQQYYCRLADGGKATVEADELDEALEGVEVIDGVEGMLPYDAVSLARGADAVSVADLIDP